ncbi:MAG: peptidylprolyl isomerase [Endomicrobia bacterium]|nr:peptidylprolyl isomerase [Endomicrobiia bacterium]
MKKVFCISLLLFFSDVLLSTQQISEKNIFYGLPKGYYAAIVTDFGVIVFELYEKQAPKTVKNFVDLALGKKEWIDPKTGKKVKKRFYDGLIFHRVIQNFMAQTGCPKGDGTGGPGYEFEDEFYEGLIFDRPGRVAMANRGPNTNGSQIFITVVETPWLNMKHTIFGQVVRGLDVVQKIVAVPKDEFNKPYSPVYIRKVLIKRIR